MEGTEEAEPYLTFAAACRLLGTTYPLLRRRVATGELTVYRTGKNIKWRLLARKELEDMLRIEPLEGKETSDAVRVA